MHVSVSVYNSNKYLLCYGMNLHKPILFGKLILSIVCRRSVVIILFLLSFGICVRILFAYECLWVSEWMSEYYVIPRISLSFICKCTGLNGIICMWNIPCGYSFFVLFSTVRHSMPFIHSFIRSITITDFFLALFFLSMLFTHYRLDQNCLNGFDSMMWHCWYCWYCCWGSDYLYYYC